MQVTYINEDGVATTTKMDKYNGPKTFKAFPKAFAETYGEFYALTLDGSELPVRVSTGSALSGDRTPYFYVYIYLDGVSYSFPKNVAPKIGTAVERVAEVAKPVAVAKSAEVDDFEVEPTPAIAAYVAAHGTKPTKPAKPARAPKK